MDESEIEKMKADAESHADEDQKRRDLVDAKNQGNGLCYEMEKQLKEHGDKLDDSERDAISAAAADLKKALETDDLGEIQAKSESLKQASYKLAEKMYAETGEAGADGPMPEAGPEATEGVADGDEKIIDADFEVKS